MAKNRIKIPKSVAGIRIPKRLRKSPALKYLLRTPLGQEVTAAALAAAASAAASAVAAHRAGDPHGGDLNPRRTIRKAARSLSGTAADLFSALVSAPKEKKKRKKRPEAAAPGYRNPVGSTH